MTSTIGALGGPYTFGGQAALELVALRSDFDEVVYLPNSPVLFADDGTWQAGAACVPAHASRSGIHVSTHRRLSHRTDLFVVAEVEHAYRCALLVRPGTELTQIREVLGHTGSLNQSRRWLTDNIPGVELTVVDSHSQGAANAVAESDGSIASVGSEQLAAEVGLNILARDIDGGSVGLYWALAPELREASQPDRIVVAGQARDGHDLTTMLGAVAAAGFTVTSVFSEAVGDRLFHQDVVAYGVGAGSLPALREALGQVPGFRVAGAYEATPVAPQRGANHEIEGAGIR